MTSGLVIDHKMQVTPCRFFTVNIYSDLGRQSHARPRRCKSQGCQISDNPSGGAGAAFRGISQRHGLSGGALAVMGLPGVHGVSERGGASMRLLGALVLNS